jgi:hypothetical protein
MLRFDRYRRLEPAQPTTDLDRGFRAEIADPLWLLGRQWRLGEHQGEDAASPVQVSFRPSHDPLDPVGADAAFDPRTTPPEAIVESEAGDWWTAGRRIRLGIEAGALLTAAQRSDPELQLRGLPAPYHGLDGAGLDGLEIWRRRAALGLDGAPVFDDVPADPVDLWDPTELAYDASFTCAGRSLSMRRHGGGDVDWWSVDADGPLPAPAPPPAQAEMIASRLRYPGAPLPRWWAIEDAQVDIGGFAPDRSHFATMLLIDLVVSHSDDWFTFPVPGESGTILRLHDVHVRDSFGDEWELSPPSDGWTLFQVEGLDGGSLLLWPTVTSPLAGDPLEEVVLGTDEDSNLLVAVERRLEGRDVQTDAPPPQEPPPGAGQLDQTVQSRYRYRPSTPLVPNRHPYEVAEVGGRRRFVQERFADLSADPPELLPEPRAAMLMDPNAPAAGPAHQIEPATVPTLGLHLERRWMLARRTDGTPILWMQRRRLPLLAPPVIDVRFDVLEGVDQVVNP